MAGRVQRGQKSAGEQVSALRRLAFYMTSDVQTSSLGQEIIVKASNKQNGIKPLCVGLYRSFSEVHPRLFLLQQGPP